jgi:cell division protein FtsB
MKFTKRSEEPDGAETPKDAGNAPAPQKNPNASVMRYFIILFAVALVLIVFSFVMHQRSNAEVMSQLQSQVDTIERLQKVESDYGALKEKSDELQTSVDTLTDQYNAADKERSAFELLWKLESLYNTQQYAECKNVITALQKDDLYTALPADDKDVNAVSGEHAYETPLAAYQRIADDVAKK